MKKIFITCAIFLLISINVNAASKVESAGIFYGLSSECFSKGMCSITDMVKVGINITKYMSAIIGSIALLFFILSGIKMLLSQGNSSKIGEAKQMMTQTIVGILVFLSAYLIVDFAQQTLLKNPINMGADSNSYKYTPITCKSEHPTWSCKSCGTQKECDQRVTNGKCETGLCPGDSTNLCCE